MVSTGWEATRFLTNVPRPACLMWPLLRGRGSGAPRSLPCALWMSRLCPSTHFCRAIPAWASVSQVASTTPTSLMTLASSLPKSFLVGQLPWMGGWGEVAWKQGRVQQGEGGHEGRGVTGRMTLPFSHGRRQGGREG